MSMLSDGAFAELLGSSSDVSGDLPAPSGFRVPGGAGKDKMIAGDAYEGASLQNRELAMWQPAEPAAK